MFKKLINWSRDNYSHLPWRQNRTLYKTLVSEIMLQQTTVGTVLNHFERFIEKYPSLEELATIDEEQILKDWKGLGYYRRAKNLLKIAKQLVAKFDGKIPVDYDKLIAIAGIGPYTANALIAIGANQKAICVDANLERVLSRLYALEAHKGIKLQKEIALLFEKRLISQELLQVGARAYNEALMDLGRSICKARSAACEICPLQSVCQAAKKRKPLNFPIVDSEQKEVKNFELKLLRIIVEEKGKILAYKKTNKEWLSGQYEIPSFILDSEDETLKQYPSLSDFPEAVLLPSFKTSITKYKIENFVLYASLTEFKKINRSQLTCEWVNKADNLSTASTKSFK